MRVCEYGNTKTSQDRGSPEGGNFVLDDQKFTANMPMRTTLLVFSWFATRCLASATLAHPSEPS